MRSARARAVRHKLIEAINPNRRREKKEIIALGLKTKKQYRKWQKKDRKNCF